MPLSSAQCEVGPTSPCGEKGLRCRIGVEQGQGSGSVSNIRESDTHPCRRSCTMATRPGERRQRPLPTTQQPLPLSARSRCYAGSYSSEEAYMWMDFTDLPWVVCGSAILEKTPRARNSECIACTFRILKGVLIRSARHGDTQPYRTDVCV